MSTDYPPAEEHFVPRNFMFNSNTPVACVIHKTGGDATPQAVYNTFLASGNPGKSVHYAIGQDGIIWQFVPESLGAGGNGAPDSTMQPFWQPYVQDYGNLNMCTISIEHCDPSPQNDTPLTSAQKQASFALVAHLCQKYGIDADHIKPHHSICATNCPGNYPWSELFAFLASDQEKEGEMIDIHSPDAATFFTESDANHWICKATGKVLAFGMLAFYKRDNGLSRLGLPVSNEIAIDARGATRQHFERGVLFYDPHHVFDRPPGAGDVYYAYIYQGLGQDPRIAELQSQVASQAPGSQQAAAKLAQIKAIVG